MINDGLCGASARAAAKTGVILSLSLLSLHEYCISYGLS